MRHGPATRTAVGVPSYGVVGLFSKASDSFAHGLNECARVAAIAPHSRIGTVCCVTLSE